MLIMGISSGCSTSKCRSSFAASSCSSSKTDGGTQDGLTMCDRKTSAVAPAGAAICSAPETQAEPDPKTGGSGTLALRSRAWLSCWPPHCQSTASLMLLLLHCTCDMCMRMSAHARARLACCERHARLESYVSGPLEMRLALLRCVPLLFCRSAALCRLLLSSLCCLRSALAVFTLLSSLGCHVLCWVVMATPALGAFAVVAAHPPPLFAPVLPRPRHRRTSASARRWCVSHHPCCTKRAAHLAAWLAPAP